MTFKWFRVFFAPFNGDLRQIYLRGCAPQSKSICKFCKHARYTQSPPQFSKLDLIKQNAELIGQITIEKTAGYGSILNDKYESILKKSLSASSKFRPSSRCYIKSSGSSPRRKLRAYYYAQNSRLRKFHTLCKENLNSATLGPPCEMAYSAPEQLGVLQRPKTRRFQCRNFSNNQRSSINHLSLDMGRKSLKEKFEILSASATPVLRVGSQIVRNIIESTTTEYEEKAMQLSKAEKEAEFFPNKDFNGWINTAHVVAPIAQLKRRDNKSKYDSDNNKTLMKKSDVLETRFLGAYLQKQDDTEKFKKEVPEIDPNRDPNKKSINNHNFDSSAEINLLTSKPSEYKLNTVSSAPLTTAKSSDLFKHRSFHLIKNANTGKLEVELVVYGDVEKKLMYPTLTECKTKAKPEQGRSIRYSKSGEKREVSKTDLYKENESVAKNAIYKITQKAQAKINEMKSKKIINPPSYVNYKLHSSPLWGNAVDPRRTIKPLKINKEMLTKLRKLKIYYENEEQSALENDSIEMDQYDTAKTVYPTNESAAHLKESKQLRIVMPSMNLGSQKDTRSGAKPVYRSFSELAKEPNIGFRLIPGNLKIKKHYRIRYPKNYPRVAYPKSWSNVAKTIIDKVANSTEARTNIDLSTPNDDNESGGNNGGDNSTGSGMSGNSGPPVPVFPQMIGKQMPKRATVNCRRYYDYKKGAQDVRKRAAKRLPISIACKSNSEDLPISDVGQQGLSLRQDDDNNDLEKKTAMLISKSKLNQRGIKSYRLKQNQENEADFVLNSDTNYDTASKKDFIDNSLEPPEQDDKPRRSSEVINEAFTADGTSKSEIFLKIETNDRKLYKNAMEPCANCGLFHSPSKHSTKCPLAEMLKASDYGNHRILSQNSRRSFSTSSSRLKTFTSAEELLHVCKYCGLVHQNEAEICPMKEALKLFIGDKKEEVPFKLIPLLKVSPNERLMEKFKNLEHKLIHFTNCNSNNFMTTDKIMFKKPMASMGFKKPEVRLKKVMKNRVAENHFSSTFKTLQKSRKLKEDELAKFKKNLRDLLTDLLKKCNQGMKLSNNAKIVKGKMRFIIEERGNQQSTEEFLNNKKELDNKNEISRPDNESEIKPISQTATLNNDQIGSVGRKLTIEPHNGVKGSSKIKLAHKESKVLVNSAIEDCGKSRFIFEITCSSAKLGNTNSKRNNSSSSRHFNTCCTSLSTVNKHDPIIIDKDATKPPPTLRKVMEGVVEDLPDDSREHVELLCYPTFHQPNVADKWREYKASATTRPSNDLPRKSPKEVAVNFGSDKPLTNMTKSSKQESSKSGCYKRLSDQMLENRLKILKSKMDVKNASSDNTINTNKLYKITLESLKKDIVTVSKSENVLQPRRSGNVRNSVKLGNLKANSSVSNKSLTNVAVNRTSSPGRLIKCSIAKISPRCSKELPKKYSSAKNRKELKSGSMSNRQNKLDSPKRNLIKYREPYKYSLFPLETSKGEEHEEKNTSQQNRQSRRFSTRHPNDSRNMAKDDCKMENCSISIKFQKENDHDSTFKHKIKKCECLNDKKESAECSPTSRVKDEDCAPKECSQLSCVVCGEAQDCIPGRRLCQKNANIREVLTDVLHIKNCCEMDFIQNRIRRERERMEAKRKRLNEEFYKDYKCDGHRSVMLIECANPSVKPLQECVRPFTYTCNNEQSKVDKTKRKLKDDYEECLENRKRKPKELECKPNQTDITKPNDRELVPIECTSIRQEVCKEPDCQYKSSKGEEFIYAIDSRREVQRKEGMIIPIFSEKNLAEKNNCEHEDEPKVCRNRSIESKNCKQEHKERKLCPERNDCSDKNDMETKNVRSICAPCPSLKDRNKLAPAKKHSGVLNSHKKESTMFCASAVVSKEETKKPTICCKKNNGIIYPEISKEHLDVICKQVLKEIESKKRTNKETSEGKMNNNEEPCPKVDEETQCSDPRGQQLAKCLQEVRKCLDDYRRCLIDLKLMPKRADDYPSGNSERASQSTPSLSLKERDKEEGKWKRKSISQSKLYIKNAKSPKLKYDCNKDKKLQKYRKEFKAADHNRKDSVSEIDYLNPTVKQCNYLPNLQEPTVVFQMPGMDDKGSCKEDSSPRKKYSKDFAVRSKFSKRPYEAKHQYEKCGLSTREKNLKSSSKNMEDVNALKEEFIDSKSTSSRGAQFDSVEYETVFFPQPRKYVDAEFKLDEKKPGCSTRDYVSNHTKISSYDVEPSATERLGEVCAKVDDTFHEEPCREEVASEEKECKKKKLPTCAGYVYTQLDSPPVPVTAQSCIQAKQIKQEEVDYVYNSDVDEFWSPKFYPQINGCKQYTRKRKNASESGKRRLKLKSPGGNSLFKGTFREDANNARSSRPPRERFSGLRYDGKHDYCESSKIRNNKNKNVNSLKCKYEVVAQTSLTNILMDACNDFKSNAQECCKGLYNAYKSKIDTYRPPAKNSKRKPGRFQDD